MARMALGEGADIAQILTALDQGTVMIRFFSRKKGNPQKRIFCLKTDTFEVLQYPMARGRHTLSEESSTNKIMYMDMCMNAIRSWWCLCK